jgi:DNA-binding transcriptional ArsR family regulator
MVMVVSGIAPLLPVGALKNRLRSRGVHLPGSTPSALGESAAAARRDSAAAEKQLDIFQYRNMMPPAMARAATTTDAFNAVAEPRRRQILDLLAEGESAVGELVSRLGVVQPQVSKHLKVLREVGLVSVREEGRRRLYRLEAGGLEQIHEWISGYQHFWSERLEEMDAVVQELKTISEGGDDDEEG